MEPPAAITALRSSAISGSLLLLMISALTWRVPLTLRTQGWPTVPDATSTARRSGAILVPGWNWPWA